MEFIQKSQIPMVKEIFGDPEEFRKNHEAFLLINSRDTKIITYFLRINLTTDLSPLKFTHRANF